MRSNNSFDVVGGVDDDDDDDTVVLADVVEITPFFLESLVSLSVLSSLLNQLTRFVKDETKPLDALSESSYDEVVVEVVVAVDIFVLVESCVIPSLLSSLLFANIRRWHAVRCCSW